MINHDISQDHDISQNHDISRDKSIKKIVFNIHKLCGD